MSIIYINFRIKRTKVKRSFTTAVLGCHFFTYRIVKKHLLSKVILDRLAVKLNVIGVKRYE